MGIFYRCIKIIQVYKNYTKPSGLLQGICYDCNRKTYQYLFICYICFGLYLISTFIHMYMFGALYLIFVLLYMYIRGALYCITVLFIYCLMLPDFGANAVNFVYSVQVFKQTILRVLLFSNGQVWGRARSRIGFIFNTLYLILIMVFNPGFCPFDTVVFLLI